MDIKQKQTEITRRSFVKGAALAGGAIAGSSLLSGLAEGAQAAAGTLPKKWDREADVLVIGRDFQPIPRLYAGGEVTGGIQGANRLGGNATPDCLFYGRVAGKNASLLKAWDSQKA